jgi:hypothetical protein
MTTANGPTAPLGQPVAELIVAVAATEVRSAVNVCAEALPENCRRDGIRGP